jgi:hypothetical protein
LNWKEGDIPLPSSSAELVEELEFAAVKFMFLQAAAAPAAKSLSHEATFFSFLLSRKIPLKEFIALTCTGPDGRRRRSTELLYTNTEIQRFG